MTYMYARCLVRLWVEYIGSRLYVTGEHKAIMLQYHRTLTLAQN